MRNSFPEFEEDYDEPRHHPGEGVTSFGITVNILYFGGIMEKDFLQIFASSGAQAIQGEAADNTQDYTAVTEKGGEEKGADENVPETENHGKASENLPKEEMAKEDTDEKSENDTGEKENKVSAAKIAEELIRKRAQENLSRYLREESEKLREIYPSFSLEDEMKNSPEFMHLLSSGVSLRRAFETVNLEKIMGSALRYAVMSAGKKTAETLRNSKRVSENSLQNSASSVMHTDVNSLTGKDIMRILSEVSKGAKISF